MDYKYCYGLNETSCHRWKNCQNVSLAKKKWMHRERFLMRRLLKGFGTCEIFQNSGHNGALIPLVVVD